MELNVPKTRRKNQFDMDDDWDANVEHDLVRTKQVLSIENLPDAREPRLSASSSRSNNASRNSTSSPSRPNVSNTTSLYSSSTSSTRNGLKVQYEKILKGKPFSLRQFRVLIEQIHQTR